LCGAWQTGAFLVVSVSAWYLLKKRHLDFARASLGVGLTVGLAASLLQLVSGDFSARGVAKNQPAKLAAFEGLYNTTSNAPLTLVGYPYLVYSQPDAVNGPTIYNAVSSPKTLGIMLVIACIGLPLVIAYTVCIYWVFRGKVKLDRMSY